MDGPAPSPPTPPPVAPPAALSRREAQVALAVFLTILVGLLAFRGYGNRLGARPTEQVTAARIDLNRAERSELEQVPHVGPKLAEAIDTHRKQKGPFRSVDELRDVKGVGPATLDKLRPYLRVDANTTPAAAASLPDADPPLLERKRPAAPPVQPLAPVRAAGSRKLQPGDPPVNVNTATADELQRLPGIGPVTAQAIAAGRPFQSVADLDRVKGIGAKTVEKLRPFVTVE
jgi:competence protein ComEA